MRRLLRRGLGVQQVAAELADVLEQRAVPAEDVGPELMGRKSFADHHRPATHQNRAGREHTADAVVHRQTVVHPVARPSVEQAGKPMAPLQQAKMAHGGGLGQTGGARGVNVEGRILDRERPALAFPQRFAGVSRDVAIEAGERVVAGALGPDPGGPR